MKILELGSRFISTEKLPYLSDYTFLDFDGIILDYSEILRNQQSATGARYLQRKAALEEFLKHKEIPLIVFAPVNYGINFQFPGISVKPKLSDLLPINSFATSLQSGTNINIVNNTPFTAFFQKYIQYFQYNVFFTEYSGTPLLEAPHSRRVLSFYNEHAIMLPHLIINSVLELEKAFLQDLFNSVKSINAIGQFDLPEWTKEYHLPGENTLLDNLKELDMEANRIKEEIALKQVELSSLQQIKGLLTETGDLLEGEVKRLFLELGCEILEAEKDRDDLIIQYEDWVAVVEIKGVTGSSAEKHSAQLEKWVSTYYEKTEVRPKGILVVNSYRNTPLESREGTTFPHQMLNYATQREHCLISTVQLIGLYLEIKNDTSKKDSLLTELFETVGIYSKYDDWKTFIQKAQE